MAEQLIYKNDAELHFPFELVRPQLSWLPQYLDAHSTDRDLDENLLNTVMVFGRARTSALLLMVHWPRVYELTKLLNSAARAVGASHHVLELDKCGGSFFVTCSRSPRDQWSRPMTHYQIGQNLDYYALGHLMMDSGRKRSRPSCHATNSTNTIKREKHGDAAIRP